MMIATILSNRDQYKDLDCENTKTWKAHVPEWLHEYENVFSKHKSERIPLWKPYDHVIDFIEDTKLPKPAKVYHYLQQKETLLTHGSMRNLKEYICLSTSLIAAPFFFVKKHNGSL